MPYTSYYPTGGTGAGYDWTYLIIILILFVVSMIVQSSVKKQYDKYGKVIASSQLSGAEAAAKLLEANGISNIAITEKAGAKLSDAYDPKANVIYLSSDTYNGRSISAIGVACHEAGHAIQDAKDYAPLKLRMRCIPFASVCSRIAIPLIFAGLILSAFASQLKIFAIVGVILFAVAVFVQLVTLPVEFDASNRALKNIAECNILTSEELTGAKKVLGAAAMTYVVSTLISVVQLLRFLSILNRR